ncbi:hypothetical protein EG327_001821 [Venturia inaequalis]|uniref:Uncharacterized protein n=1 Tax=Venturia inaequalis TaxID=5025 RepID=A0A8H3VM13_VENIN|nr:hypothetical protein EG327_001821 [Venturia inaequalis]
MAAEKATRHQSVSSVQSSAQSSAFEEQLSDSTGDVSKLSSAAETQRSALEEYSYTQEQSNERVRARASQMRMKGFLEKSPMFGKSLSPAENINAEENVRAG